MDAFFIGKVYQVSNLNKSKWTERSRKFAV